MSSWMKSPGPGAPANVASAVRRRIAEVVPAVSPPPVDHRRRNEAFGDERRIAMLHIPKSAGNSVATALHEVLPNHSWSPYVFDPSQFGSMRNEPLPERQVGQVLPDPSMLREYSAATGHFSLSTLLAAFDAADVVMLVREPRARLLSHYQYWRGLDEFHRDERNTWRVTAKATQLHFGEWIIDPETAYQTDNILVRMLLAGHPAIPDNDFIDPDDLRSLTPLAIRAARSIGWVDVIERGAEMWDGLGERVGAELPRLSLNETKHRLELPTDASVLFEPATVTAIYERTVADAMIWHDAAVRRNVENPRLVAEQSWATRIRSVLDPYFER
ncbi:MAG: sulfotransferase domain-containing protein [Ilumatobacter sp.]|nr:sulfotransferase domain-containing protein [Ilumatobacter sp.]